MVGRWAGSSLVGVEDQFAEEFAGGGVDDADVQVLDEEQDAGSGVGPADADVVEASVVAEGDERRCRRCGRCGRGRGCRRRGRRGLALGRAA